MTHRGGKKVLGVESKGTRQVSSQPLPSISSTAQGSLPRPPHTHLDRLLRNISLCHLPTFCLWVGLTLSSPAECKKPPHRVMACEATLSLVAGDQCKPDWVCELSPRCCFLGVGCSGFVPEASAKLSNSPRTTWLDWVDQSLKSDSTALLG